MEAHYGEHTTPQSRREAAPPTTLQSRGGCPTHYPTVQRRGCPTHYPTGQRRGCPTHYPTGHSLLQCRPRLLLGLLLRLCLCRLGDRDLDRCLLLRDECEECDGGERERCDPCEEEVLLDSGEREVRLSLKDLTLRSVSPSSKGEGDLL